MKAIIVYDSLYGNTENIAKAIGEGIGRDARVERMGDADPGGLRAYDLVIVGSPTQGGRPAVTIKEFLDKIPEGALKDVSAAAFDTRLKTGLVKIFGYAAGKIAGALEERGARLVAPGEGFFVKGSRGALVDGELERAAAWGKKLAAGIK